jgi:FAD/FMN-containing dehydrogenase
VVSEPNDLETSDVEWHNWAGDERCRPMAIVHPSSVEEIAAAMERAGREGWRVRVAGAGHSFSDIACTDGLLIVLDRFEELALGNEQRFDRLYLIEGERLIEELPTYRGEGWCFL